MKRLRQSAIVYAELESSSLEDVSVDEEAELEEDVSGGGGGRAGVFGAAVDLGGSGGGAMR